MVLGCNTQNSTGTKRRTVKTTTEHHTTLLLLRPSWSQWQRWWHNTRKLRERRGGGSLYKKRRRRRREGAATCWPAPLRGSCLSNQRLNDIQQVKIRPEGVSNQTTTSTLDNRITVTHTWQLQQHQCLPAARLLTGLTVDSFSGSINRLINQSQCWHLLLYLYLTYW